jgi:hypothetical protein
LAIELDATTLEQATKNLPLGVVEIFGSGPILIRSRGWRTT